MRKTISVSVFLLFLFGLVPSYNVSSSVTFNLEIPLKANAFSDERGFTQQYTIAWVEQGTYDTENGFCIFEIAQTQIWESCTLGLEPCGADASRWKSWHSEIIGGFKEGVTCHEIEY